MLEAETAIRRYQQPHLKQELLHAVEVPHEATRSALPTAPSQAGNAITHQFQLYNMYDRKSLPLLRRRCEVAML